MAVYSEEYTCKSTEYIRTTRNPSVALINTDANHLSTVACRRNTYLLNYLFRLRWTQKKYIQVPAYVIIFPCVYTSSMRFLIPHAVVWTLFICVR